MRDVMRVDIDALRDAEPAFETLASAVDGVLSRLTASLRAEGRCWGGDDVGQSFDKDYLDGVSNACDGMATLRDAVTQIGQSVLAAADSVDAAEDRTRSRLT
jgi:uncharacterized protein YukE